MKKKNRNYGFLMLILGIAGAFLAYGQYQLNVQTNQASIDYGISTNEQTRFYAVEDNLRIWCRNGGGMDGKFYLVASFTNASVPTGQSYAVNSTLVKVPFVLHKSNADGHESQLDISFTPDSDVSGFLVSLSLERRDNNPLVANPFKFNPLQCVWNRQLNCFEVVN